MADPSERDVRARAWAGVTQFKRNGSGGASPPPPSVPLVPPIAPTSVALQAASDFAAWQAKVRAQQERNRDQPLSDCYRMTWEPPASWGAIVERTAILYRGGIPAEQLRFSNHEPVIRLRVRVHGVDH